jgi:hypothetical protein
MMASRPIEELLVKETRDRGAALVRTLAWQMSQEDQAPGLLDERLMTDALMFAAAILIEANPSVVTQNDLEQAAVEQAQVFFAMLHAVRATAESSGAHLLEQLGGISVADSERPN